MINDNIKFPAKYDPANADAHISETVISKQFTAGDAWQYLINLSDWTRFNNDIIDVNFIDSSINDPHLFPKVEFHFRTQNFDITAHVLECIEPKADRPGRISWEGVATSMGNIPKIKVQFVHAFLVDNQNNKSTRIVSEISILGKDIRKLESIEPKQITSLNYSWLQGLSKYVTRHVKATNHPRNPQHGALVD